MNNLLIALLVVLAIVVCGKLANGYIKVMGNYYRRMYSEIGKEQ